MTKLVDWPSELGVPQYYVIFLFIILGGSIGFVFGGIFGRELTLQWRRVEQLVREIAPADLLLGTAGLVVGLLLALLASQPLRLLSPEWLSVTVTGVLMFVCAYACVSVALWKRRELAMMFPRLAPTELATASERTVVLDTSAIIDGRFVELHRLGFMPGSLRVPRFVLGELQTLADSSDETRRARGRRGLDLLASLPDNERVEVFEADYNDTAAVDEKLLRLSGDAKSALVTVDYNLAKVARVRGIQVLNLNDAATALRPNYLPGEVIRIKVAKPGKEAEQGVGYLDDGTMVVVQGGRDHVGSETGVEVTSVLQTSAGRMIFARLNGEGASESVNA
ncbi:MAG TPA: TRAM domain-containing protein [Coriobacteriia bacterium]